MGAATLSMHLAPLGFSASAFRRYANPRRVSARFDRTDPGRFGRREFTDEASILPGPGTRRFSLVRFRRVHQGGRSWAGQMVGLERRGRTAEPKSGRLKRAAKQTDGAVLSDSARRGDRAPRPVSRHEVTTGPQDVTPRRDPSSPMTAKVSAVP